MKSKKLGLFMLSVFTFAVLISFASAAAATFTLSPTTLTFDKNETSNTFTITNTASSGLLNMTLASQTLTDSASNTVVLSFNESALSIAAGASKLVTATSASASTGFLFEKATRTYNINQTSNSTNNVALTLNYVNSFCSSGSANDANLKLKVDISNRGEGDDNDWVPLDTIEVEVKLENDGNDDLNDVFFELGLYKKGSNTNIIDDMIWLSEDDEEVEVGDIDEDENEKFTFEFRVDPSEVDDGNYRLVVKAYPDGEESKTCIDHSENLEDSTFGTSLDSVAEIKVSKENEKEKSVVIDEKSYPTPINAFCGEQVTFTADLYNIGDQDFEDQTKVTLINNALGLNIEDIINGDMDEGEKGEAMFTFNIPTSTVEKTYTLDMEIFYDYDKDDENYDEVSEETFEALLKVQGNCDGSASTGTEAKATVNAVLESGGKAGEELIIKATITNTGTNTATYVLNAAGFTTWASSAEVLPNTVTLTAGQSQEVSIKLNVNKDVSGDKLFDIEVISGNSVVVKQPVSASVKAASGFSSITGNVAGSNVYLWGIGLLNVILILAIVFVVVRLMRK